MKLYTFDTDAGALTPGILASALSGPGSVATADPRNPPAASGDGKIYEAGGAAGGGNQVILRGHIGRSDERPHVFVARGGVVESFFLPGLLLLENLIEARDANEQLSAVSFPRLGRKGILAVGHHVVFLGVDGVPRAAPLSQFLASANQLLESVARAEIAAQQSLDSPTFPATP